MFCVLVIQSAFTWGGKVLHGTYCQVYHIYICTQWVWTHLQRFVVGANITLTVTMHRKFTKSTRSVEQCAHHTSVCLFNHMAPHPPFFPSQPVASPVCAQCLSVLLAMMDSLILPIPEDMVSSFHLPAQFSYGQSSQLSNMWVQPIQQFLKCSPYIYRSMETSFVFTAISHLEGFWQLNQGQTVIAVYFSTYFLPFLSNFKTFFLSFHTLTTHEQQRQDTRHHRIGTKKQA